MTKPIPLLPEAAAAAEVRLMVLRFGCLMSEWRLFSFAVDRLLFAAAGYWDDVCCGLVGRPPLHACERRMRHCLAVAHALAGLGIEGSAASRWLRRRNPALGGISPLTAITVEADVLRRLKDSLVREHEKNML